MRSECLNRRVRRSCSGAILLTGLVAATVMAGGCARRPPSYTSLRSQGGITGAVARWLTEYQEAWNARDSAKLGRMLNLEQSQVWGLQRLFEERSNLHVVLDDVHIEPVDDSLARATYVRHDRWIDRATGQPRYFSVAYEQSFRLAGDEVRQVSLRRR